MNNKTIITIAIIILVLLVGFFIFNSGFGGDQATDEEQNQETTQPEDPRNLQTAEDDFSVIDEAVELLE